MDPLMEKVSLEDGVGELEGMGRQVKLLDAPTVRLYVQAGQGIGRLDDRGQKYPAGHRVGTPE
jgi:hypothetical protein